MAISDTYRTTAQIAEELDITPAEVERCRKMFGIEVEKMGAARWWTEKDRDLLSRLRHAMRNNLCPDCESPIPWPAPTPRKRKAAATPPAETTE